MAKVVHHGWENFYPESNEPSDWGASCGLDTFNNFTNNWDKVTCKRCLKRAPQNIMEQNGHNAQQAKAQN